MTKLLSNKIEVNEVRVLGKFCRNNYVLVNSIGIIMFWECLSKIVSPDFCNLKLN